MQIDRKTAAQAYHAVCLLNERVTQLIITEVDKNLDLFTRAGIRKPAFDLTIACYEQRIVELETCLTKLPPNRDEYVSLLTDVSIQIMRSLIANLYNELHSQPDTATTTGESGLK